MLFPTLSPSARATIVSFVVFALLPVLGLLRAETPREAVDRVWDGFMHLDPNRGSNNFPREFWKLSKAVAREQGVAVLPPIMARARDWKDEEVLIFVPLVDLLPREQAIKVLNHYKNKGKPWERQAADDFLSEFDMSDTKEAVKEARQL
jgi:hypothetical protein